MMKAIEAVAYGILGAFALFMLMTLMQALQKGLN